VWPVELLRQLPDDGGPRRVGEEGELPQVLARGVTVRRALERRADEYRALLRSGERDQVACDWRCLR